MNKEFPEGDFYNLEELIATLKRQRWQLLNIVSYVPQNDAQKTVVAEGIVHLKKISEIFEALGVEDECDLMKTTRH